jgi:predicted nucleic acid-binding Zn ribbon protein
VSTERTERSGTGPGSGGPGSGGPGPGGLGGGSRSKKRAARAHRTVGVAESLAELSRQLGTGPPDTLSTVFSRWSETVGETVAAHTHPERIDDEALVVSVDSPAWASHLRTLAPALLGQLRDATGSDKLSRLVVRVKAPKKGPDVDI